MMIIRRPPSALPFVLLSTFFISSHAKHFSPKECESWLRQALRSDADSSEGLSELEFSSFLSSITSSYFPDFDSLPKDYKEMYEYLTCECYYSLGKKKSCCDQDDAEVPLDGFEKEGKDRSKKEKDYRHEFCHEVSYVEDKLDHSFMPTAMYTQGLEDTTEVPTYVPTHGPTNQPTEIPTSKPTNIPTDLPTTSPSKKPTSIPTNIPTSKPTHTPTRTTTSLPTKKPTNMATDTPTLLVTDSDIGSTEQPTPQPTPIPTPKPTPKPTLKPTPKLTPGPSPENSTSAPISALIESTSDPTLLPTSTPTNFPTLTTSMPTSIDLSTNIPTTVPSPLQIAFLGSVNAQYASDEIVGMSTNSDGEEHVILKQVILGFWSVSFDILVSILEEQTGEYGGSRRNMLKMMDSDEIASLESLVDDVDCPDGVIYARSDDPCLEFTLVLRPTKGGPLIASVIPAFLADVLSAINDDGLLYDTVFENDSSTEIVGLGNPGKGIPYQNSGTEEVNAITNAVNRNEPVIEDDGGIFGAGAIIGIALAALVVLIFIVLFVYRRRRERKILLSFAGQDAPNDWRRDSRPPVKDLDELDEFGSVGLRTVSDSPALPMQVQPNHDDSKSESSSIWSKSNLDDSVVEGSVVSEEGIEVEENLGVRSTLAAMGMASTVAIRMAPSTNHNGSSPTNYVYDKSDVFEDEDGLTYEVTLE